ncbi:hypothetical protein BaRGS_00002419 [Batillaria attramentaria]|uniref:Uncharacterized protein n=1 Tax=Batillaria attramentaria TaxID=370345 RepID=A0ABD0M4X5_9CAEN
MLGQLFLQGRRVHKRVVGIVNHGLQAWGCTTARNERHSSHVTVKKLSLGSATAYSPLPVLPVGAGSLYSIDKSAPFACKHPGMTVKHNKMIVLVRSVELRNTPVNL